jgi:hypothetical protein
MRFAKQQAFISQQLLFKFQISQLRLPKHSTRVMRLTRLKSRTLLIRSFLSIMMEKLWTKIKYNNRHTV